MTMDESGGKWLKLEDGVEVDIGPKLLEHNDVPATIVLQLPTCSPHNTANTPKIHQQQSAERTIKGRKTTQGSQTEGSELLGPGAHPGLFFPAFEAMIQTLVDLQGSLEKRKQ